MEVVSSTFSSEIKERRALRGRDDGRPRPRGDGGGAALHPGGAAALRGAAIASASRLTTARGAIIDHLGANRGGGGSAARGAPAHAGEPRENLGGQQGEDALEQGARAHRGTRRRIGGPRRSSCCRQQEQEARSAPSWGAAPARPAAARRIAAAEAEEAEKGRRAAAAAEMRQAAARRRRRGHAKPRAGARRRCRPPRAPRAPGVVLHRRRARADLGVAEQRWLGVRARRANKTLSAETRAKLSRAMKEKWAAATARSARARTARTRSSAARRSQRRSGRVADPDYRNRTIAGIRRTRMARQRGASRRRTRSAPHGARSRRR